MKKFKQLRTEINTIEEEYSEGGGFGFDPVLKSKGRSAQDQIQPTELDDPHDIQKLNAFITAFCSKSYVDPRSALYLLRAKINLAGFDFDLTRASDLSLNNEHSFLIKRFGGTFGTSPSHDLRKEFERTNGFGDKNYVLKVTIMAPSGGGQSGLFMLKAHIEPL